MCHPSHNLFHHRNMPITLMLLSLLTSLSFSAFTLDTGLLQLVIVAVWITSAVYSVPKFIFVRTITNNLGDDQLETICIINRKAFNSELFDIINFALLYLLPLLVMTVSVAHRQCNDLSSHVRFTLSFNLFLFSITPGPVQPDSDSTVEKLPGVGATHRTAEHHLVQLLEQFQSKAEQQVREKGRRSHRKSGWYGVLW